MYANYHTHTYLCNHATGTLEEYVLKAIERGVKILGFSDHVPMPFSKDGYNSFFRMKPEQVPLYVETVLHLKEKYKNDITIYLGYEAEFFPREFERMMKLITSYPIDYLILGQHFSNNEYDGKSNVGAREYEDLVKLVDTYIAAMDTGVFTYIAHPDLLPYTADSELYDRQMTRLIRYATDTGTPLEYNLLGMKEHRFYPHPRFWELVGELGATVIIGCDVHETSMMADPVLVEQARKALASFGITPVETVKLRKPVI